MFLFLHIAYCISLSFEGQFSNSSLSFHLNALQSSAVFYVSRSYPVDLKRILSSNHVLGVYWDTNNEQDLVATSHWVHQTTGLWPKLVRIPSKTRTFEKSMIVKQYGYLEFTPSIDKTACGTLKEQSTWSLVHYTPNCKSMYTGSNKVVPVNIKDVYNNQEPKKTYTHLFQCQNITVALKCTESSNIEYLQCLNTRCTKLLQKCRTYPPIVDDSACEYTKLANEFFCDKKNLDFSCNAINTTKVQEYNAVSLLSGDVVGLVSSAQRNRWL